MSTPTTSSNKQKLIIVGNGMVGHHFAEQLVESGALAGFEVTIFGEERHRAYDRVHLSEYFSGRDAESLALCDADYYHTHGIQLRSGEAVTAIDREQQLVVTEQGHYAYDQLVLATGSFPFVPPIPGNDSEGCLVYRTLDDLDAIQAAAKNATNGVVVGGGLLGLEAANALRGLNLDTAVVEFAPRLMPMQVDSEGGELLKEKIEALGVQVLTERATQRIEPGDTSRLRMVFQDDKVLETDLIVFSAGIRPQDTLARECGLSIGERGGVVIDDQCRTSDPNILAIGEVALWNQSIFGLVAPGYQMAKTAVATLTGGDICFSGADMSTKLKLLGVDVGSIGDAHGNQNPGARMFRYLDPLTQVYRKLVVTSDGKKLLGAMLVGDNSAYDTLLQYYANGIELPKEPASLILPQQSGAAPSLGPDALPETAMICSCHNVTKGSICSAIDAGAADLGSVKGATKASTGCGGCAALLKSVVDHELVARGVEVDTSICEHFAHTRQGLYDIVRVEGIKTFSELMQKHGNAETHRLGCDICKPAVASILASCFNEPITDAAHVPLQDTNDTFMANMQKNGTYSVVPRIAGGEITPDKLVVLGQVAQKYQLYTKITGGQRIDLFGARLEDLPAIWGELIEAGFETGHAYGKSLRTVKSCVGSTWCRYGVQDSVGMAIQLENRYKGLRAPHKIKFGVSGCTRECAEAQSKDIGIIATENGWNLYVCGNGGMRPRHAELFATDLDDEQLYRTIDRFLMFYVRTADRLQRTSVWRENLEGGLDYLKEVILEDSLGINDELERQMQHVVDSYQCEWANAISDPEKLKRFRNFVNDARPDPSIIMTSERGQLRPA
ncbi:MAG: nitrite reductase (NAD(P)H) [Halomonas sp.]|jgi:nitrite reductase (NADH) large subunit|uniref:nitrite reductase large subunit NirB n=1 Tax=Vreelandella aquamarina TaxID=77097 RepID=UPI000C121BE5|nr:MULTISPECIES: nitrite reductase large subunit NirB [Halomonas]MCD1652445.1 nitrite reductase large subunit NirB [Halomonas axialensis]MCD2088741.1 nitrite reductase large subunit NirB [Halomonas meridiana]PHR04310.1 MAG: nitrite reductase (NAD(P)H) [Halomonas sp.]